MAGLAHVVTVDPTGTIARLVRAALEITGQVVVQIDVRTAEDALDEMQRTGCDLLVTPLRLNDHLHGVDLAAAVKEAYSDAAVIVLGDADDPADLDAEMRSVTSFTYLRRSVDGVQFMRALAVALGAPDRAGEGERAPNYAPRLALTDLDLGPIPPLDMKVAERVIDSLLVDVGAMAIVVANRAGAILLERGAVGYLDRELLTSALLPTVKSTVDMGQLIGGQPAALQFYDGENYDVFVLSIGFHHFMCLVFDGQAGSRQFGAVNRFGRRAAEDLVTLLGIFAFTITPTAASDTQSTPFEPEQEVIAVPVESLIERAEIWAQTEPEPLPELEPVMLEPLEELDVNLFDDTLIADLDAAAADDLFDPDKLAEIANETRRERGPLSYDEARELGIIP